MKLKLIPKIILFLVIFIFLSYIYMHFIENHYISSQEYSFKSNNLEKEFDGFKIAFFSDIHYGRSTNIKEIKDVVKIINEMKADIVLFNGDLLDNYIIINDQDKTNIINELSKINANYGKFYINGDNDYANIEIYKNIMESSKFKLLKNEEVNIYKDNLNPIHIDGIDSVSNNEDKYDFISKDGFHIVMCHEPVCFDKLPSNVDLVLSAHNLGGLIRLPFIGGLFYNNNVNQYKDSTYNKMFISNGIGTEKIDLRLFNTPKVYLIRLYYEN